MDPVSVVLAGLALATALKDVIELGRKLNESLARVSRNMDRSRRLSGEIYMSLQQLEKVYEKQSQVISQSQELNDALINLKLEIEVVFMKCVTFVQPTTKTGVKRMMAAFKAWKASRAIEEELVLLKDHANACHVQFTTYATARIEGTAQQIKEATERIEHSTARLEQQVFFLNASEASCLREIQATVTTTTMAGHPSSAVRSPKKPASDVVHSAVADQYLSFQVAAIEQSLSNFPSMKLPQLDGLVADDYTKQFGSIVYARPFGVPKATRHREVVMLTLDVLQRLQQDSNTRSMAEGAYDMLNLAISLHHLKMFQEAVTIGEWTVNIFRTLLDSNTEFFEPYLGLALLNLARYYQDTDPEKSLPTVEESIEINRAFASRKSSPDALDHLGRSLLTYSAILSKRMEYEKAFSAVQEALQIFQDHLREISQWANDSETAEDSAASVSSQTLTESISLTLNDDHEEDLDGEVFGYNRLLYDYGRSMMQASQIFEETGRLAEAQTMNHDTKKIFQHLSAIFPNSIMEESYGATLYRLGHSVYRDSTPASEAVEYTSQAVTIYRRLCKVDSAVYLRPLYDVLWQYATILGSLERYDEAHTTWMEAVDVAKGIITDQICLADALNQVCGILRRLDRYEDAVVLRIQSIQTYRVVLKKANGHEADASHELAVDYQLVGRFQESRQSASNAVSQYRALAFENPAEFEEKLANGLTAWANALFVLQENEKALEKSLEATKLYEKIIERDPTILSRYIRCLLISDNASFQLQEDPDKAIVTGLEVIRQFRKLAAKFPDHKLQPDLKLAQAMEQHGLLLSKLDRLEDSVSWGEEVALYFESTDLQRRSVALSAKYIACLINIASDLDNLGRSIDALVPLRKAIEASKDFRDAEPVATLIASVMLREADVCLELGRYSEALASSLASVEFVRARPLEDVTEVAGCLVSYSEALNCNGRPLEASQTAREAVDLCRQAPMENLIQSNMFAPLQLPHALQALSQALGDAGDDIQALEVARECFEECTKLKGIQDQLPWTFSESSYAEALHSLAFEMFRTQDADIEGHLNFLEESKGIHISRSEGRKAAFVDVACTLRVMGLVYCSLGRHEEGIAARGELTNLLSRLSIAFPTVHLRTTVALERDRTRPAWVRYSRHLPLQCQHQEEPSYM